MKIPFMIILILMVSLFFILDSAFAGGLIYSTYLGGGGEDEGNGIAIDGSGNAYITGYTYSSDFPKMWGAFDTTYNGNGDVFVTKLNTNGTALVYSTFLGGSGRDEGVDITIDDSGNAYITGGTESPNFPTTLGAFDTTYNGSVDVFVSKLNPSGTALIYSTYLGGANLDYGADITIDSLENAYITGGTQSSTFPTTTNAFDTSYNGSRDVFVAKLNASGTALFYSTYLGGGLADGGYGIAIDTAGNAYITGYCSSNFPTTPGTFDSSFNGGNNDIFVSKLNPSGTALVYSTYLGGVSDDAGGYIALDDSENVYVTGVTLSTNFPTTPGAFDTTPNGSSDVFVTKLNASGTALVYSTYLGGGDEDDGYGLVVDGSGNAYIVGYTMSTDFPTTLDAFDTSYNGSSDVILSKLDSTGTTLDYSTYLGGNDFEHGLGIAIDNSRNVYLTGYTFHYSGSYYPTTPGAFDTSYNGGISDVFVSKLYLGPLFVNEWLRYE
jgi:hypothetical protein